MSYFELAFMAFACVGDIGYSWIGLSISPIPDRLRPLAATVGVCSVAPGIERFTVRAAADRRIKELGPAPAPRLKWCKNFKCWDREIRWSDRLVIDGREIK